MNLNKIISFVLITISVGLFYYLYNSIDSTIQERKRIETTEAAIIEKLSIIREAEKVFHEQFGRYTANWDSLINFIENGKVPITQRTETIIPQSYGEEKVIVKIDTIGIISAKDKIFKKNFTINASSNGTFLGFFVKENDNVVKGSRSYKMNREGVEHTDEYTFLEGGTISTVANVKPGQQVTKGQLLLTLWNYQYNVDVDIKTLNIAPVSNKSFEITVSKIDRSGLKVSAIEVRDPSPINPTRRGDNKEKNRQALHFGSKTDVSTSGNWE